MMSVLMLSVFGTPLMQKQQQPQSADAFKLDYTHGHYAITRKALWFLEPHILDELDRGHHRYDSPKSLEVGKGFFSATQHFDNCRFQDGTLLINSLYNDMLKTRPGGWGKEEQILFARILHAAQDFYAHTNWVELGRRTLIDSEKNDLWKVLKPNDWSARGPNNNVWITGSQQMPAGWKITLDPKTMKAWVEPTDRKSPWYGTKYDALISGLVPYELKGTLIDANCPAKARTGHWAWWAGPLAATLLALIPGVPMRVSVAVLYANLVPPGTPGLNKDSPSKAGYPAASNLAWYQTYNEWCRLLNLVEKKYGVSAKESLAANWVQGDPVIITPKKFYPNPVHLEALKGCPLPRHVASSGPAAPLDQSTPSEEEQQSSLQTLRDRMNQRAQAPPPPPLSSSPPPTGPPVIELPPPGPDPVAPPDPLEGLIPPGILTDPGGEIPSIDIPGEIIEPPAIEPGPKEPGGTDTGSSARS
jgi:hypothetical protein